MTKEEFKNKLQSELIQQGFMDSIKRIDLPLFKWHEKKAVENTQIIIVFDAPLTNVVMLEWMKKRFNHGSFTISENKKRVILDELNDVQEKPPEPESEDLFAKVMDSADNAKLIREMAQVLTELIKHPLKLYGCEKSFILRKTILDDGFVETDVMDENQIEQAEFYENIINIINKTK